MNFKISFIWFSLVWILIHLYLFQYEKKTARIVFHFSNVYVLDYSMTVTHKIIWFLQTISLKHISRPREESMIGFTSDSASYKPQWYINGCSPALIHAFSDVFKVDNISWHTKWILKCHLFGFSLVCILIHLYLLQYEKKTARIMFHFSNVYVLDYSRFGVFWGAWILKFLIFFRLLYSASNSTRCVWNKNI